jgi:hypothetical protein
MVSIYLNGTVACVVKWGIEPYQSIIAMINHKN